MFRVLALAVLFLSGALGQLFDRPVETEGKSIDAPQPTLVEMPYEKTPLPNLQPAPVAEVTKSSVHLPSPMLDVPKKLEDVVDIPHAPIPVPKGGVEEVPVEYKVQQPIIEVPEPIVQKKRVYFNVPQPIFQVPEPVIRHRPILYKVPHVLKLHRPVVTHERVLYNVPQAQIKPKSGYN